MYYLKTTDGYYICELRGIVFVTYCTEKENALAWHKSKDMEQIRRTVSSIAGTSLIVEEV